ncbi:MAG: class I SAM-dependent methyltransferase [Deltaproteobacteria bacterium]|nr:class I SAM-dependent methyltransferase [Deltaproteobacteria bacterium]
MRELIRDFVRICNEHLTILEPIYEFGSLQVQGQEGFSDLRPLFPGREYLGADIRPGLGVDLILDLHDIDLPTASVGAVILMDTLEHVEYPRKAMDEINRVLKPDGLVLISSVMAFPIHEYPSDYWRFTPAGFASLLNKFPFSLVEFAGVPSFPHTVVGVGANSPPGASVLLRLRQDLTTWKETWDNPIEFHAKIDSPDVVQALLAEREARLEFVYNSWPWKLSIGLGRCRGAVKRFFSK